MIVEVFDHAAWPNPVRRPDVLGGAHAPRLVPLETPSKGPDSPRQRVNPLSFRFREVLSRDDFLCGQTATHIGSSGVKL